MTLTGVVVVLFSSPGISAMNVYEVIEGRGPEFPRKDPKGAPADEGRGKSIGSFRVSGASSFEVLPSWKFGMEVQSIPRETSISVKSNWMPGWRVRPVRAADAAFRADSEAVGSPDPN